MVDVQSTTCLKAMGDAVQWKVDGGEGGESGGGLQGGI